MKKCCCCINIRTGAFTIAIFGIIRGLLYFMGLWYLFDLDNSQKKIEQSIHEIDGNISNITPAYVNYCVYAGTILFIFVNLVLLLGLIKNQWILLQIWLIFDGAIGLVSNMINEYKRFFFGFH